MEPATNKQDEDFFSDQVTKKEKRKLRALRENSGGVWSGLGMMGMIGWSVAVPCLLGAALGIWLDKKYPESFSWTLTFLFSGLITGSIVAWYWVEKEDKAMHNNKEENND